MFTVNINNTKWVWAAFGKHNVAKDYIAIGHINPVLKGFSNWMEQGYRQVSDEDKKKEQRSWRFWAKGLGRQLICGLVKDSMDKIGRPFPLLIIGTGKVENWEENWELLPLACKLTWNRIETISKTDFKDLGKMKEVLKKIPAPEDNWPQLKNDASLCEQQYSWIGKRSISPELYNFMNSIERVIRDSIIKFYVDESNVTQLADPLVKVNLLLKNRLQNIPNITFAGGLMNTTWQLFIKRSLSISDFKTLWSLEKE